MLSIPLRLRLMIDKICRTLQMLLDKSGHPMAMRLALERTGDAGNDIVVVMTFVDKYKCR